MSWLSTMSVRMAAVPPAPKPAPAPQQHLVNLLNRDREAAAKAVAAEEHSKLRDAAALVVMQGILAGNPPMQASTEVAERFAKNVWMLTDAFMAEREKAA
ncbi:MAG: hypothetical protein ACK4ZW_05750 [Blastomonas sp.]